ncbi:Protoglobin-domain-containing protein [Aspergillus novoparasiticus]|uniref:Protoglobin-domain-containing protein n=1 Tax=Aspergillus novoparasiticus TaxID=986946 RepID=A0A5N6E625_9EURO|nr:Protoglobin-domain-containing protein [Aspergillus novoparasiticus]
MEPGKDVNDGVQYIRRRELYTDLQKRIEYLHAFLNISGPSIPTLSHRLYEKLLQFDITARALRTRTTATDMHVEDFFTIDSPHVERRKIFWKWYLYKLCSDPSRIEYWDYLDKVGIHSYECLSWLYTRSVL